MISDVYFPRVNGVSTSIRTFREALQKQGHRVTLIAPNYPGQRCEDDKDIIRIDSVRVPFDPEDRMMSRRKIKILLYKLALKNVGIIHIHTPFVAHYSGVWLARQLEVPCLESYHTFFEEYLYHYIPFIPRNWLKRLARKFSQSQCNAVDSIVVPSTPMHEVLKGYGVTAPAHIIPTGIHPDNFSIGNGNVFREKHWIEKNRPVMLYLGRVAHEKNIDFLLHVVAETKKRIENVLMIVAGEGPAVSTLKKLAGELGINENIMFIGYLSRQQDLPDCYAAANVYVFASRTETQGLVLLEAMAAGTPVVSTAVMGTADVLEDKQGALIAEETVSNFSKKVIRVLANPETERLLGISAQHYVQGWTVSESTTRLSSLYDGLITEHQRLTLSDNLHILQDMDT